MKFWPVFVLILMGAVSTGGLLVKVATAETAVADNAEKIIKVEEAVDAVKEDIADINNTVTRLEANQENAIMDLDEIKGLIREVAAAVKESNE